MDSEALRHELGELSRLTGEQTEWITTLEEDNSRLQSDVDDVKGRIVDLEHEISSKEYTLQSLKDQLNNAGCGRASDIDAEILLGIACRTDQPTPLECLEIIESLYGDKCTILNSAKDSAREVSQFIHGRRLLDMLRRLVTEYRSKLIQGGDAKAKEAFGQNEYAAKESETVMKSKAMKRIRIFDYNGEQVEMFSHLKIGVDDDDSKTIRVHFHWDANSKLIVIGYAGKHLPIASH